jgi:hypothetical protein
LAVLYFLIYASKVSLDPAHRDSEFTDQNLIIQKPEAVRRESESGTLIRQKFQPIGLEFLPLKNFEATLDLE